VGALLVTWSLGTARYGGPDEPAHVIRAYAVAHGDVLGDRPDPATLDLAPGYRVVDVPASLASGDPACFRHDSTVTPDCAVASTSTEPVAAATSAGINPPLYYAVVGTLARLGDAADPTSYRIAAALLAGVVLLLAARRMAPLARRSNRAGLVALAAVTPAAWFLFGVVNPNALEITLAALAWVGVARWWCEPDHRTARAALWIGVPLAVAVTARPVALATAGAALALTCLAGRPTRRALVALGAPLAAALLSLAAWQAALGAGFVDDPRTARRGSIVDALGQALGGLPRTAAELVGSLGWLEYRAPLIAQLLWCAALVAVCRRGWRSSDRRLRRATAVWAVLLVATPVVFEVAFFGSIGPIWQGRYSIPLWLGGAALVVIAQHDSGDERRYRGLTTVLPVLAAVEVLTFWTVLRRATVGTDGSWWFAHAVTVGAPDHPRFLLVAHLALVMLLAVTMQRHRSLTARHSASQ